MNEASPLVPQGSFEAHARGKSRVKFAFYTIVVVHVLAIAGFLIIGCKREDRDAASNTTPTNDLSTPVFGTDPGIVSAPATDTNLPVAVAPTSSPGVTATPVTPAVATQPPPVIDPIPAAASEHTLVKNDTFATLATRYGVSVRAIQAANPNLNPTRLQIGDKVKIPAKTATAGNGAVSNGDSGLYTVKSGDTLEKIARAQRTTVRELQRANNLTTTQIRVGQKLKIPVAVPVGSTPPAAQ
ncbi:MAG TPA: LysM peptidoglycan-binding domain-containing protein [Methylomirabilota bacterium]|nr:LysM peptidoglycan-binding domain-containing protein [Methylomirabilota bacterium]